MNSVNSTYFDIDQITRNSFVEQVYFQNQMESTNDWALTNCSAETLESPLLVLTDIQTAGRGRGENIWNAAVGSLTFSLVIRSKQFVNDSKSLSLVPMASALAVAASIDEQAKPLFSIQMHRMPCSACEFKWPNDVMLANKKVCGILCETIGAELLVIGIGINVWNELDSNVTPFATTIMSESGRRVELQSFLMDLISNLEREIKSLDQSNESRIHRIRDKFWLDGKKISMIQGEKKTEGIVKGISEKGGLLLQTNEGLETFFSGQVML